MLYISYQGIYNGTNFEEANTPNQIGRAFNSGFSCLVDVWRINGSLCLGTEFDPIPVTDRYLQGNRFWLNARNSDAYDWLIAQPRKSYPYVFKFASDTESTPAAVTGGKTIVPGNVPIDDSSIVFLPEGPDRGLFSTVKLRNYGICSCYLTFIKRMRNEGAPFYGDINIPY